MEPVEMTGGTGTGEQTQLTATSPDAGSEESMAGFLEESFGELFMVGFVEPLVKKKTDETVEELRAE